MNSSGNELRRQANHLVLLLGLLAFILASGVYLVQSASIRVQAQQVHVVELKAKKYEFDPSPLHVKAGTKVQLKISALDHDHGFKIAMYPDGAKSSGQPGLVFTSAQDCWLLKKGETTTIEFIAQTPGTYPFHCCHRCGLGHHDMNAELIVD